MKNNQQIRNDIVESFYTWWSERIVGVAENTPKQKMIEMFTSEVTQVLDEEISALYNQSLSSSK